MLMIYPKILIDDLFTDVKLLLKQIHKLVNIIIYFK